MIWLYLLLLILQIFYEKIKKQDYKLKVTSEFYFEIDFDIYCNRHYENSI